MKRLSRDLKTFGTIKVSIIGSGLMGSSLLAQLEMLEGFEVAVFSSRRMEPMKKALEKAKIPLEKTLFTNDLLEAKQGRKARKLIVTTNNTLAWKLDVHGVCDCTGNTVAGAEIGIESIVSRRHVISFNVETDVLIGHKCRDLSKQYDVVYTGIYGDEPGSILELYEFCTFLGFEVVALGKGKNNPLDHEATPTKLKEEALAKGLSPRMLTSFVDGTNTMIELNAVCNATGFLPDVPGCHGFEGKVEDLDTLFLPKELGGKISKPKVVDFVKGIAPGVFAIVKPKREILDAEMRFLKMGNGPLYTIYRPYHLTSLEVPITIAKAVLYQESSIEPYQNPVAQTIAVAKKDLKPGDSLEGIGGEAVYGTLVSMDMAKNHQAVPIGLCTPKGKVLKPIKKGEWIKEKEIQLEDNVLTEVYFKERL